VAPTDSQTPSVRAAAPTTAPSPTAVEPTATQAASLPSISVASRDTIPRRFRYARLSWGPVTRIWLVDLDERVIPRLVIRLEHMGSGDHTVSKDGEIVVLAAPGEHGYSAVQIIRPRSGTRTIVHEERDTQVPGTPVVTPAGDRYAFTKQIAGVDGFPGGRADLGMWVGATSGGPPTLAVRGGVAEPSRPIAWSPDGRSLAFVRGPDMFLLAASGEERRLGTGIDAAWLSNTTVLVARGQMAGSGIDRYEVGTSSVREELRTTGWVIAVLADPTGRRYAYIERTGAEDLLTSGTFWLRDVGGGPARQLDAQGMRDLMWSSDGSALTGISGGDDSVTGVHDLLDGFSVPLCLRSDGLPPPPPSGCV
jgi:Tol biopolymer transport system component